MTRSHLSVLTLATAMSAVLIGSTLPSLAAPAPVNWKQQEAETLRHYRALVQLDTSSPPGNETRAVDYLKGVFEKEGIAVKTFALDPKRANLVARIKGNGSKRPILLMSHTDVVGVQREKWPVDPFGAVLSEGYVWGRGTRDDKDNLTANLMTMLLIKRNGVALDRDVIFLAESGEEADPAGVGIPLGLRHGRSGAVSGRHVVRDGACLILGAGGRQRCQHEQVERQDGRDGGAHSASVWSSKPNIRPAERLVSARVGRACYGP